MNLPASLRRAAREGRLVPFVGAGVSLSVRTEDDLPLFPDWVGLLGHGARRLREEAFVTEADIVVGLAQTGRVRDAAQILREELTGQFGDWLRTALKRSFDEAAPDSLVLAQLVWQLGSQLILTTNYDDVLRWACPRPHDLDVWPSVAPGASVRDLGYPTLWHLHGSIADPDNVVISTDDYVRLYETESIESNRFLTVLRTVLRENSLLFVGFSMDDAYVNNELDWLDKHFPSTGRQHFLLVREDRLELTHERLASKRSLTVVGYEDHGEPLRAILRALADEAGGGTPPAPAARVVPGGATRRTAVDAYLRTAQRVNGLLQLPGIDRVVPTEQVWIGPSFTDIVGEKLPFHRLLSHKAVVIQAPAGSGKSTFARFLATILARDRLGMPAPDDSSWQEAFLGVQPGAVTEVPILLMANNIDPRRGAEGLLAAASPTIGDTHLAELRGLIDKGEVAFIVDGLDEASPSDRPEILRTLVQAHQDWEGCYFIVTTRVGDVSALTHCGFASASIAPLAPGDGTRLCHRCAAALIDDGADAKVFVARLGAALRRGHELTPMLSLPLFATFLCWNYVVSRTLPTNRVALYDSVADWLLESRAEQRLAAGVDTSTAWMVLETVASLLVQGIGDSGPVASADVRALVPEAAADLGFPAENVERAIRVEIALGNCLVESRGQVAFWHLNLRDYFAARWLHRRQKVAGLALADEVRTAMWNPDWHECWELLVGLLARDSPGLIEPFLDAIKRLSGSGHEDMIRTAALRSRVLDLAEIHGYRPSATYRQSVRKEIEPTLDAAEAHLFQMPRADRVSAFTALGTLQLDRRLYGKPTGRLRTVDAATGVSMGRYPVTVQEYGRFVRSGGYDDLRWSSDYRQVYWWHGWHAPLAWEQQKRMPNAPVVGVSWHEAMAYCRWLSAELGMSGTVRLPTPAEWCQAVSGDLTLMRTGDPYALRSSATRAAITEALEPDVPVGIRPELRGPLGHDDITGLVWEWLGPRSRRGRRRRDQITADEERVPITRLRRGVQRDDRVGFRIVYQDPAYATAGDQSAAPPA